MKYSDKEISGVDQAGEPEAAYAAATDRQFSHQLGLEHSAKDAIHSLLYHD